jgi:hypothetical protein
MQRVFIIAANCVVLVAMLLGPSEVAGVRFGHWQISSVPASQTLRFWSLVAAAVANAGAAKFLIKGRKDQHLCWHWSIVFAAIVAGEFAYERGCFNFSWIKSGLLWVLSTLHLK